MRYSLASYRSILTHALEAGYSFVPFHGECANLNNKHIYLRHDVDYSLEMALELARVNAELEIQGTFCVLLRSQVYNLVSPWSLDVLRRILQLGQYIGLHAAIPSQDQVTAGVVESQLRTDFLFAQSNIPSLSHVFSWHNPTPQILAMSLPMRHFADLTNAYAAQFTRDIAYFSDSNLRHLPEDFMRAIGSGAHPALHLLFHPLNWVAGGSTMQEILAATWKRVIREREHEIRLNRVYAKLLPDGMPESVLERFADLWSQAAIIADGE